MLNISNALEEIPKSQKFAGMHPNRLENAIYKKLLQLSIT